MSWLIVLTVAYIIIASFIMGYVLSDETEFVNPEYGKAIFLSVLWLPAWLVGVGWMLWDKYR